MGIQSIYHTEKNSSRNFYQLLAILEYMDKWRLFNINETGLISTLSNVMSSQFF